MYVKKMIQERLKELDRFERRIKGKIELLENDLSRAKDDLTEVRNEMAELHMEEQNINKQGEIKFTSSNELHVNVPKPGGSLNVCSCAVKRVLEHQENRV
jgi:predicted  nucleic acid-binding Zn-ribbon protein